MIATHQPRIPSAAFLALALCALSASAQPFTVDWFSIDGGGAMNGTGGVFTIDGTIGQPDAGPTVSGGNFSVTGGFWSLIAVVQTSGAPRLTVNLTTSNSAIIIWPLPATGFSLQENLALGTTGWVDVTNRLRDDGLNKFIIVNPATSARFYRLFKP